MDFGFIAADENVVFTAAAIVMLVLAAIEIVGLVLAASPFGFLDDLIPDADDGGLGKGLAWLNAGRLPALAFLIVLLTLFVVIGYGLQLAVRASSSELADGWLLALPALLGSAFLTRWLSRWLAPRLPRDESTAIGLDELVGRVAQVTIGEVRQDEPGRATLRDRHGNLHNLRVAAARDADRFQAGERVLLAARQGQLFLVTAVPDALRQPGEGETR